MDDTKRIISKSILTDIADAIREKHGYNQLLKPSEFAEEIRTIAGGGSGEGTLPITIEPVSNVVYDTNTTTLSWTAGDNSAIIEEYDAIIEYKVSLNGNDLRTSNTSLNIGTYLYEGTNNITIDTISTIQTSEMQENVAKSITVNTSVTYEDTEPGLKLLTVKLPKPMAYMSAIGNGDNIYLVGGVDENLALNDKIYRFNTRTKSIEEFAELPQINNVKGISMASLGIYNNTLFITSCNTKTPTNGNMILSSRGSSYCYKIDLTSGNVTYFEIPRWHPSTFPRYAPRWEYNAYATYDNTVYMIDGSDLEGSVNKGITGFNMETEFYDNISARYDSGTNHAFASIYNNNIYMFGGYESTSGSKNTIEKLGISSGTRTTLSSSLPKGLTGGSAEFYDNAIYIVGGYSSADSSVLKVLMKFNVISENVTPLSSYSFPNGLAFVATATANNNLYIFGGRDENSSFIDTIYRFRA